MKVSDLLTLAQDNLAAEIHIYESYTELEIVEYYVGVISGNIHITVERKEST